MANLNASKRDPLFDNYRVLLIFLVVIGHVIETIYQNNWFLTGSKYIIYAFHIPAFVFISGYFSKKEESLFALLKKLIVPYLIFEVLYYLLYTFVTHKETKLYLLHPKFTLWYLLALFFWKAITPYVKKIPGYLILTILAGLAIGFSPMKDNFLTIPRAVVFYPYFLAGTLLKRETVDNLRKQMIGSFRLSYLFSAFSIVTIILVFLFADRFTISPNIFYGRYSYATMEQTPLLGISLRLFAYGIGFLISYGLLLILPEKEYRISVIGQRTLQIYLFHGLFYKIIEKTELLEQVNTLPETLLLFIGIILCTCVLATKPFTKLLKLLCLNVK